MATRFWPNRNDARRHRLRGIAIVGIVLLSFYIADSRADTRAEPASFNDRFLSASAQDENVPAAESADKTSERAAIAGTPDRGRLVPARDARGDYRTLIESEAKREGLAPEIAEAVMSVESGFNPAAIGGDGEIGLMQILPSTARMLGFVGSNADLAVPATNIRYGVTYLGQAWRRAGGDLCTAVMKYRAGHGETRFSYLSVDYCRKVRTRLAARGFAVTGVVPTPTFGSPVRLARGERCRGRCLAGSGGGADIVALNARLSRIVFRVSVLNVPRP
ncbi:lytic transglycosylase domain-containing protein [Pseudorhodoplanes sp.]|uniref:lytic transglycosylase domain-containing protein n=1 Tax=Pseudorhodoplanes sp. TaxID=1934341 RepID=UPI002C428150|nr:transglycosylase SLT domain-containing protein [Pseudorhodoplanes sp.]HWV51674.1 transglycosylase SLT domain-containing protein [Pseudorhodoplanes sp.]